MRSFTFFCIALIVIGAPAISVGQSIGFSLERAYFIAGLDGVDEAELDDIDHDGLPEILVRRNNHILLYSAKNDSVLFERFLDTAAVAYRIELGDINRDAVADIVAACIYPISKWDGYTDSAYAIDFFDGALDYQPSRQYNSNWDHGYSYSIFNTFYLSTGIASFDILDINSDGYGELLVSYCNKVTDSSYLNQVWHAVYPSYTRGFYSYPDSLLWSQYFYLTDPRAVHVDDAHFLAGNYLYREGFGDWNGDESYTRRSIILFDSSSLSAYDHAEEANLSCAEHGELRTRSDILDQACIGDLDESVPGLEMAARYSYELDCVHTDLSFERIYGRDQRLYHIKSPNSLELLWKIDGIGFDQPVYLPEYPGYFFAFAGGRFVQISGADGSEVQSTTDIPAGDKWWDYPYHTDQPYLVVVSGNTVSLYRPGISTDSNDSPPPLPSTLSLGKPYPNPFNAAQTVPVTIVPGHDLTVDVFNLLGQKVETIYTGRPSTATLNLTWRADNLPSGVYFVRAAGDGNIAVVRSILLK